MNKLQWIWNQKTFFSLMKMHLKMSSGRWRPFCPGRDEWIIQHGPWRLVWCDLILVVGPCPVNCCPRLGYRTLDDYFASCDDSVTRHHRAQLPAEDWMPKISAKINFSNLNNVIYRIAVWHYLWLYMNGYISLSSQIKMERIRYICRISSEKLYNISLLIFQNR